MRIGAHGGSGSLSIVVRSPLRNAFRGGSPAQEHGRKRGRDEGLEGLGFSGVFSEIFIDYRLSGVVRKSMKRLKLAYCNVKTKFPRTRRQRAAGRDAAEKKQGADTPCERRVKEDAIGTPRRGRSGRREAKSTDIATEFRPRRRVDIGAPRRVRGVTPGIQRTAGDKSTDIVD